MRAHKRGAEPRPLDGPPWRGRPNTTLRACRPRRMTAPRVPARGDHSHGEGRGLGRWKANALSGRMAEGLGRRPRASPWRCKALSGRGSATTGRAKARRHYRRQKVVTAAARTLTTAKEKREGAGRDREKLCPSGAGFFHGASVRREWWRVTEGDARPRTRGAPATLRGESPMRDNPRPSGHSRLKGTTMNRCTSANPRGVPRHPPTATTTRNPLGLCPWRRPYKATNDGEARTTRTS